MKKLKELRAQKRQLKIDLRAKRGEINAETPAADIERITREVDALVVSIDAVDEQIERIEGEIEAAGGDVVAPPVVEADAQRDAGTVLSRSAVIELTTVVSQFRDLGVEIDLTDALTRNLTPDAVRKDGFAKLAEKSKKGAIASGNVEVIRDEREGVAEAMEIALTSRILGSQGRMGLQYKGLNNPAEKRFFEAHQKQSEQYRGLGLVEMAAQSIGYRGRNGFLTSNDAMVIFERAFNTTSDFPNIFQNALNKALLARYELATPTYREIAVERPFKDFRPHPQVRAGDFPQLKPINAETGELAHGNSQDNGEVLSVNPYGIVFSISRQMLVNDDLGAIDQILASASDGVTVFENTTFFTMFNSNPTLLQDGTAVFAAGHSNLAGAGSVPSVASIASGRQALRGMKSLSGQYLNVPPAIILTGPVQETAADQMVTSITPTLSTSVNPFSGKLRTISDANISDTSWYIATEASRVPCFAYGFLNGSSGPRTRTFEPFGVQGVKISLEHDFGCGAVDYRGFYKNPGA